MLRNLGKSGTGRMAVLVVILLAAGLWMRGCGSGGYDDPNATIYQNDKSSNTLVSASVVKAWFDNGCRTERGERVVVIDCVPNPDGVFPYSDKDSWFAGDKTKILVNIEKQYGGKLSPQYKSFSGMADGLFGHIPGAIPNMSHEGFEVTNRSDGPVLAEHEVGTGSLIDQMLQKYGITTKDVIVLTTSRYDYPGFCAARMWWTLRYWGFPRERILVLNGGNKAYAMAGYPLQKGVTLPVINPSTISVTQWPKKFFHERIGIGELIGLIDSGRTALPDNNANKVVILDTRQPPVAYHFKDTENGTGDGIPDIFQVAGHAYDPATKLYDAGVLTLSELLFGAGNLAIPFSSTTNPPIDLTQGAAATYLTMHKIGSAPLAIPLTPKPASFEGLIRGSKVTKTPAYNITVPGLTNADGTYKTRAELLPIFATAGIDGTKPVVTFCNSGALAAIYYYALKEICGFQEVRMYDGSWQEWGNLAAFEPVDATYVMNDDYATYPLYPKASPSVVFFSAKNNYFTYDAATRQFVDSITGAVIGTDKIKAGGNLAGNAKWDTVTRSEFVMFRPTATINSTAVPLNGGQYKNKTFVGSVDWPTLEFTPGYIGGGNQILLEDQAYKGSSVGSGGGAPTPFIPTGGGC